MINVATYDASAPEPLSIYRTVRKPTRWRLEIDLSANGTDTAIVLRLADRMWLREAQEAAFDAIREIVPEGGMVQRAVMKFWAEV